MAYFHSRGERPSSLKGCSGTCGCSAGRARAGIGEVYVRDDEDDGPVQGYAEAAAGARREPRLAARCYALRLTVPGNYGEFESAVERWIATCVQSRTRVRGTPAHRERELVRGNPTLQRVWEQLRDAAGKPATIRAEYVWGPARVESIRFSTPIATYQFEPETITASKPDTLERIIQRALQLLPQAAQHGVPLTPYQTSRIGCWLRKLQSSTTDERFLTGQSILDYRNWAGRRPVSYSSARQWLLPEFRIRQRTLTPDAEILRSVQRIDELIVQGRHRINQEFALQGAAVDVRVQELRRWMEGRERDPNSIYHCYYLQATGP